MFGGGALLDMIEQMSGNLGRSSVVLGDHMRAEPRRGLRVGVSESRPHGARRDAVAEELGGVGVAKRVKTAARQSEFNQQRREAFGHDFAAANRGAVPRVVRNTKPPSRPWRKASSRASRDAEIESSRGWPLLVGPTRPMRISPPP